MKKNDLPSWTPLLLVLALAGLGQFFMDRREEPWTLWVSLPFYLPALWLWINLNRPLPRGPQAERRALGVPGRGSRFIETQIGPGTLPPKVEWISFFFILLLAAFYRVSWLSDFPAGVFLDEACEGFGALRILHEGWRPFYEIYHLLVWDPPMYYLLALWFKFVSLSKAHFFLFSAVLSLLSFPLIYWTFRQLAGVPVALCSLFVLAVMRWDITYSRDCHPAIQLPLYMFGTLAFFLYGTRERKTWALAVAGAFFAGGFYIYQAYKAFILLMALYILYEWFIARTQKGWHSLSAFLLPAFVLSAPVWLFWWQMGNLGYREGQLFIFPGILKGGSLLPLWEHFLGTALMFNREGDSWFLHNLPYHRMLDDASGVLWILGFALALARYKKREHFYAASGLVVMALPAFLSVAATHGSRAFGTVPFLALLAGLTLSRMWDKAQEVKPAAARWALSIFLCLVPGVMADQNGWTYFIEQAGDSDCWRDASTDATFVGEKVAGEPADEEFYLSPSFYGHYSVLFLGYFQRDRMHQLDLPQGLALPSLPAGKGALFALPQGESGLLHLLQDLYPGGRTDAALDPWGKAIVHFYRINADQAETGQKRAKKFLFSKAGLRAAYFPTPDFSGKPLLTEVDPIIDFTFRGDFPVQPSPTLSVKWEGVLKVDEPGRYQFMTTMTDPVRLELDGKLLLEGMDFRKPEMTLKKGPHLIRLWFQKASGVDTALVLVWKKPGSEKWEVIPHTALGH